MKKSLLFCAAVALLLHVPNSPADSAASERRTLELGPATDRIAVRIGGRTIAEYVFRDSKIKRPYWSNLFAPDGKRVTRRHPPRKDADSTDHATMHPGIWLAFGDLNRADFWRNKAAVQHAGFVQKPVVKNGVASFMVRNRYIDKDKTVCTETCRHTLRLTSHGYLLTYDSTFRGSEGPLEFGDQEEMGLGVRMNDRLRVRGGSGEILNSDGKRNEKDVRGTNSAWCLYGGANGGRQTGIVLMPHPGNFRKSWYHARDYGVLVANPFGRRSLTGGKPSRVRIDAGKTFRLRYGVLVFSLPKDTSNSAREAAIAGVYRDYSRAAE